MIALAPLLARWALAFGPAEYFVLIVFAFCCLTSLLGREPVKGTLSAMLGLAIATVGVDANSGVYRYTFDSVHLFDGIPFVVTVIALFAIAELLEMLESTMRGQAPEVPPGKRKLFNLKELLYTKWTVARSSLLGFFIGVLPGAGASVASAVAYSNEKRYQEGRDPEAKFGRGDLRGVTAPEAASTASAVGSFVPMLTLGVPGILCISYIGVYAINAGTFDLTMAAFLGVVGYLLRKAGVPMAPMVLGVVLGDMMEQNLRRALSITNGELHILWGSPITQGLWIVSLCIVVIPPLMRWRRARRRQGGEHAGGGLVATDD